MSDVFREPGREASTLRLAHVVYALHTFALVTGVVGSPTVVGSFVGSVPSIAAVVINYVKRSDARGSWLESHFRWQIRTFWFAVLWLIVSGLLAVTIIGVPFAIALVIGLTFWLLYRIGRGWLRLNDHRPMYV